MRFLHPGGGYGTCHRSIVFCASRMGLRDVSTYSDTKSLRLNLFADPHTINPYASIFYKNSGRGHLQPFDLKSPLSRHTLAPINPLSATLVTPHISIANKRLTAEAKSFSCNIYKKHMGWGEPLPKRVRRKRYLSRGSASEVLLEPAVHPAKLSPARNSVVSECVGLAWEGAMGKFSRSWQLVKQSFAILRSDKQLMLFPVFSAISCFVLTAMIATGGAFLLLPARAAALAAVEQFHPNQSPMFLIGMFTLYVVNYF